MCGGVSICSQSIPGGGGLQYKQQHRRWMVPPPPSGLLHGRRGKKGFFGWLVYRARLFAVGWEGPFALVVDI